MPQRNEKIIENNPDNQVTQSQSKAPSYFNRNLAEFINLSRSIFSKTNSLLDMLENLGFRKQEAVADLKQYQFEQNLNQQRQDFILKQRLGNLQLQSLPTKTDIAFQSLMSGLGSAFNIYYGNKISGQIYQSLMDWLNRPSPFQ